MTFGVLVLAAPHSHHAIAERPAVVTRVAESKSSAHKSPRTRPMRHDAATSTRSAHTAAPRGAGPTPTRTNITHRLIDHQHLCAPGTRRTNAPTGLNCTPYRARSVLVITVPLPHTPTDVNHIGVGSKIDCSKLPTIPLTRCETQPSGS
jgi:hypothetical protein